MLFALFFAFWRSLEIVTLIPTVGMTAWFVHGFVNQNELTPDYLLVIFIVSVLALAWAIATLFAYHRSSTNALFVGLVDLAFVGAFIGAVHTLRFIAGADCTHVTTGADWLVSAGNLITISGHDGIHITTNKPCAMLKASFAFGIMNVVFFFFTAVLAVLHGNRLGAQERDRRYVSGTRSGSRQHGRHSSHRSGSRSRGHRSSSHRSSHSHQRTYV